MPAGIGTSAFGAVDALVPDDLAEGTPRWWLAYLDQCLSARLPYYQERDAYYEGDHPLAFATSKFREAFGDMFTEFADNWCPVVVDIAAERLRVEGFRFGDSEDSDDEAWEIWQRNLLDAESSTGMQEAIKLGEAAVIVEPVEGGVPRITVEHPSQVYVHLDPGDRRNRLAAIKRWQDDFGNTFYNVYLPEGVYRWEVPEGAELVERQNGSHFVPNGPLEGFVAAVPLQNNPSLLYGGRSDLDVVIPVQRAIDKLATDMVVASEFSAYKQRLLTGVEIPKYPEGHEKAGQPMSDLFTMGVTRLLTVEAPDAKAQEFSAADLKNYVDAIEMFVQHIAAQTRTPPHYLTGTVVNASGDALKAAETGLVSKVRGKSRYFEIGWEEVMRLAFRAMGDAERADEAKIETIWGDFENRSESEAADAVAKLKDLEIPPEALWERIPNVTQQQRDRWSEMRKEWLQELERRAEAESNRATEQAKAVASARSSQAAPSNGE